MSRLLRLFLVIILGAAQGWWLSQPVGLPIVSYVVQPGDTLSGIAIAHGTTVDSLVALNVERYPGLAHHLRAGYELQVESNKAKPRWQATLEYVGGLLPHTTVKRQPGGVGGNDVDGGQAISQPPTAAPTSVGRVETYFDYNAALEIVQLTNAERTQVGLPALNIDDPLMTVAQRRAQEIVTNFSHTGLRNACQTCGENINMLGDSYARRGVAGAIMAGWMNSAGHRENILRAGISRIGVGVYHVDGVFYAVQEFDY